MIFTTVVLVAVFMFACLVGIAVIPRFDGRPAIGPMEPVLASEPRVGA